MSERAKFLITRSLLWSVVSFTVLGLVLPGFMIVPMAFNPARTFAFPPQGFSTRWFESLWNSPQWYSALTNSFTFAVSVTVLATTIGTMSALGLHRMRSKKAAAGLRALLLAPLVLPVITLAIGIYSVYLRLGLVGTFHGFVFAHTVLALPFVMISVETSLKGFDPVFERAAASLGAGPAVTFFKITLPNIVPGVISGALFAFTTSFDEIMVSLFVRTPGMNTLPVLMYQSASRDVDPTAAAAATVMLGSLLLILSLFGLVLALRSRKIERVS